MSTATSTETVATASPDLPESDPALSRRGFLGATTALMIGFHLPSASAAAKPEAAELAPNAYVRVGQDGKVTIVVALTEMGQGTFTSVPMLIAEELDVRLDQVTIEQAPADEKRYGHPLYVLQVTGGSAGIRGAWAKLRQVGATTRLMLVTAAADTWKVPVSECQTLDGVVTHPASGRKLTYGQLVPAARKLPMPAEAPLKDPAKFRLVGTRAHRTDTPAKVNGTALFGIDAKVKGMKVGAIAVCPVIGGTVGKVDSTETLKVKGVRRVVQSETAVLVIADHYGAAKKGLAALKVEWNDGANAAFSTAEWQRQQEQALKDQTGITPHNVGDFDAAWRSGAQRLEAVYIAPALAHATMEPLNCTIHVRRDSCDIWLGTQAPARAQGLVAAVVGLPPEKVAVHNYYIGGGFGRKLDADYVELAAKLVKQVDYPVKVIFSREEDMQHDAYRPLFRDEMAAALDTKGKLVAFRHRVAGPAVISRYAPVWVGNGHDRDAVEVAETAYDIKDARVDYVRHEPPAGLMTGNWRGVGPAHHVFVTEGFIDELAVLAKADPVAYRLGMLESKPRLAAVLRLAADKAGWGKPVKKGSGRGVAVLEGFGSFGALVLDITVDTEGNVKLDRAVCAVDCGLMINPDGVEAQAQSGLIYGLSAAMFGLITFDQGRVQQSNFHDHPVLRFNEAPVMEILTVRSSLPPGGTGELATPLAAPALLNAIYAATGKRFRTYPVTAEQLKAT